MKKKRKFLLSFILLTLGIFCFATTAHAKSQLVQLKAGKTDKISHFLSFNTNLY